MGKRRELQPAPSCYACGVTGTPLESRITSGETVIVCVDTASCKKRWKEKGDG